MPKSMRLIIAGSRDIDICVTAIDFLLIKFDLKPTEIVSGRSRGVDTSGEIYANAKQIPLALFPAKWDELGRKAGPIRNGEMAKYADVALVIHHGSGGSLNMIQQMKAVGKPVFEVVLTNFKK